jgi:hypothetical protein
MHIFSIYAHLQYICTSSIYMHMFSIYAHLQYICTSSVYMHIFICTLLAHALLRPLNKLACYEIPYYATVTRYPYCTQPINYTYCTIRKGKRDYAVPTCSSLCSLTDLYGRFGGIRCLHFGPLKVNAPDVSVMCLRFYGAT